MQQLTTALLLATASALIPPAAPRRQQVLRARDEGVLHKVPIIEGEAVDPASDPSRPRWLYVPTMVPNASQWDVVLDARSPSEYEEDRILGALSTPVLDDDERAEVGTLYAANSFQARVRGASLVANRLSKILSDDRIATLQVRTHTGTKFVVKLGYDACVGDLRAEIDARLGAAAPAYDVRTAFPAKAYGDDAATLESAGLVPTAVILVQKRSP